jgi:hypothetical protein
MKSTVFKGLHLIYNTRGKQAFISKFISNALWWRVLGNTWPQERYTRKQANLL